MKTLCIVATILIASASSAGLIGEGFEGRRDRHLADDHALPKTLAAHQGICSNYLASAEGQQAVNAMIDARIDAMPGRLLNQYWAEGGLGMLLTLLAGKQGLKMYANRSKPDEAG